jgi:hypothetical protein
MRKTNTNDGAGDTYPGFLRLPRKGGTSKIGCSGPAGVVGHVVSLAFDHEEGCAKNPHYAIEKVLFHGSVPTPKRNTLVDRFREDGRCRAFLATDAGGVGLNLQHASVVVNIDDPPGLVEIPAPKRAINGEGG